MADSAKLGAQILRRYRHPDHWKDGESKRKPHLVGKRVLKVEEIRLGGGALVSVAQARANAAAIVAWAKSVGLAGKISIDQQMNKAPYVVVPEAHFDAVLAKLRSL